MLYVGVDYYPEHWPKERWETDARMMKEAGFNVVRMAEFAWAKMEPSEGQFDFEWLDRAIEILHSHGIEVVLGTPTGSMPRWVAMKYPEVVGVDINGHKIPYGARKDNCPSSLSYRLLSQRITRAMAEHYKDNPAVIGWQTDNEFGAPNCYCDTCRAAWQDWLANRFGNIDSLNQSWGTIFWGHTYRTWNEIPLPMRGRDNPSMALDYARFYSEQVVSFQKEQIDILRNVSPDKFVTHNFMGFYDNLDYYDLAGDLDFVSWDYYYNHGKPHTQRTRAYATGAAAHDLMRSLKHKDFWIMETTAGPTGNCIYSRNVRPGEMRRMNYQAVAHGANGLVWFRWRTCRYGFEQYWHGLLGHDGEANRRYREAARVAHEFKKIQDEIQPSIVKAEVAIALSYDDRWAFKIQPNGSDFNYVEHLMQYHRALVGHGVNVDFVNLEKDDISAYKVVIAPTLYIVAQETADKLREFAQNGGSLVLTFRSGVKDEENVPHDMVLPGYFRDMAGVRVEEYEALSNGDEYKVLVNDVKELNATGKYTCGVLADWIIPEGARSIASYRENGLEEYSAATVNNFGKGSVYYIGTWFKEHEFYNKLIGHILEQTDAKALVKPCEGVEVATRYNGKTAYVFILNHNDENVEVKTPNGMELLSGQKVEGQLNIPAGEVAILRINSK